jgi:hypothetical protein
MEYFDFEDASHAIPYFDLDDVSLNAQTRQDDGNDSFDALFFDKAHDLPVDPAPLAPAKLKLMNGIEIEVVRQPDDPNLSYPMFRAKNACDLCARTRLLSGLQRNHDYWLHMLHFAIQGLQFHSP